MQGRSWLSTPQLVQYGSTVQYTKGPFESGAFMYITWNNLIRACIKRVNRTTGTFEA